LSARVVRGTIEFIWDDGDQMLVNLDPDDPSDPHTFELEGPIRARVAAAFGEGDRVEVEFRPVEYEVVDPDAGPTESFRAEVRDVRACG
jgi:hypothetical protein